MKHSLIDILEEHLKSRYPDWVAAGALTDDRKWYKKNGTAYLSGTVSRKLRLAEEQKRIAVKPDPLSTSVVYKYLPEERRASYVTTSERTDPLALFKTQ